MKIFLLILLSTLFMTSSGYNLKFVMKNGAEFSIDADKISSIDFENSMVAQPYPLLDDAVVIPSNYFKGVLAPMPLPSTLKVIEDEVFYACLNKVLVIPEGVTDVGRNAFQRGYSTLSSTLNDEENRSELIGNVELIYLPKTVKKLGVHSLQGIYVNFKGWYGTEPNPTVVMSSETPPEGFISSLALDGDYVAISPYKFYVPESGIENYIIVRDDHFTQSWGYDFGVKNVPFYSYSPVSIEIIEGTNPARYEYTYLPASENQGEITGVRWATSDPEIALINAGGVLEPRKVGKTHIQCIVSTPASDGKEIEFYFFKPVEITPDMFK